MMRNGGFYLDNECIKPLTTLEHWVLVVDHDATNFNGSDYAVTVTGPNVIPNFGFFFVNNSTSGYYELFDTSINQNNLSLYTVLTRIGL